MNPAVIGDINDQRFLRQPLAVEKIEQLAHGAVEPFHVTPVTGQMLALRQRRVVIDECLRWIVRVVRQHRRIPDKKWLAIGMAGVHKIVDRLQRLAADRESLIAVTRALCHAICETAPRKMPLPPFTGLQALVATSRQQRGQRGPFFQVLGHLFATRCKCSWAGARGRIVAGDAVLMGIATGDERGKARAAEARRHIAARKDEALSRQSVEVWRAQMLVAHEGVVAPVLIVGNNQHHIGWGENRLPWHRCGGRNPSAHGQ